MASNTPGSHPVELALVDFLANHPKVECAPFTANTILLLNAWGESGFALRVDASDTAAIAALNGVILPEKFTAIWHESTHDLEVIWAPISTDFDEYSRAFSFQFEDKTYQCEYAPASQELIAISLSAVLVASRSVVEYSRFQNLSSIASFESDPPQHLAVPYHSISFWIRDVECDEEQLAKLARNLNFHMYYFDRLTPQILIHDDSASSIATQPARYPFGGFPPTIVGRPVEPFVLGLWASSTEGDVRLRFLYLYQILEYAAFYWMRDTTQQAVRRILSSPETYTAPGNAVKQIMDVLAEEKMTDEQKLYTIVKQLVEPEPVWNEIAANQRFFAQDIRFEGGVTIPAPISSSCTQADFCNDWRKGEKFPMALKTIRNALVHGREARMSNVIAPTAANDMAIRHFLSPLNCIAMRVALAIDA